MTSHAANTETAGTRVREQVGDRHLRFTDAQRRRLAIKSRRLSRRTLTGIGSIVTPDIPLRWCRNLIARKYDGSRRRGPGRPKTKGTIEQLILRMARENPRWGYIRIRGALRNLGHDVGRNWWSVGVPAAGSRLRASRDPSVTLPTATRC